MGKPGTRGAGTWVAASSILLGALVGTLPPAAGCTPEEWACVELWGDVGRSIGNVFRCGGLAPDHLTSCEAVIDWENARVAWIGMRWAPDFTGIITVQGAWVRVPPVGFASVPARMTCTVTQGVEDDCNGNPGIAICFVPPHCILRWAFTATTAPNHAACSQPNCNPGPVGTWTGCTFAPTVKGEEVIVEHYAKSSAHNNPMEACDYDVEAPNGGGSAAVQVVRLL